jgi:hypothetical protein
MGDSYKEGKFIKSWHQLGKSIKKSLELQDHGMLLTLTHQR